MTGNEPSTYIFILQIFVLWLTSSLISVPKRPVFTFIIRATLTFFLSLEVVTFWITGSSISYLIYYNLPTITFAYYQVVLTTSFLVLISWGVTLGGSLLFATYFRRFNQRTNMLCNSKTPSFLLAIFSVLILSIPGGIISEKMKLFEIIFTSERTFAKALSDLDISFESYPKKHQVTASAGQNIIVISLESFERGFLEGPFARLTPKLNALKSEWTFFDNFHQNPGGEWTAAALYNMLFGVPAFFSGHGNEIFQNARSSELVGLGHVLSIAGYKKFYVMANIQFAGTKDLLDLEGFVTISEKNSVGSYRPVSHGMHDYDMFSEAKAQITQHVRQNPNQKFAIFLSTINTHFPHGIRDPKVDKLIGKEKLTFASSIKATDYLIADFLDFLNSTDLLNKTTVFVLPDHLLLGGDQRIVAPLNEIGNRRLFLLTNSQNRTVHKQANQLNYQMHLPRLILDGAQVKTNAKFLVDYHSDNSLMELLSRRRGSISTLNNASLKVDTFLDGMKITEETNAILLKNIKTNFTKRIQLSDRDNIFLNFIFDHRFSLIETYETATLEAVSKGFKRKHMVIELQNGKIVSILISNLINKGIDLTNQAELTPKQIQDLSNEEQFNFGALKEPQTQKHNKSVHGKEPSKMSRLRFIAHAGGGINNNTYTNSLEALNHSYAKGYRLFELDLIVTQDDGIVAAHDWKHWKSITGFSGTIPPTTKVFKTQKVYNRYTPLDMKAINRWFFLHPDAVLVSDKLNLPKKLSDVFLDKSRLMMELFTWNAVEEALVANILGPMPTDYLLDKIDGDIVRFLHDKNIYNIAGSRRMSKMLAKKLADNGIRVFAFHVNFDEGKDEQFVMCNERQFFFGLYADFIEFDKPIDCLID